MLMRGEKRGFRKGGYHGLADESCQGDQSILSSSANRPDRRGTYRASNQSATASIAVPEEIDHEVTEQYWKTSGKRSDQQAPVLIGIGA